MALKCSVYVHSCRTNNSEQWKEFAVEYSRLNQMSNQCCYGNECDSFQARLKWLVLHLYKYDFLGKNRRSMLIMSATNSSNILFCGNAIHAQFNVIMFKLIPFILHHFHWHFSYKLFFTQFHDIFCTTLPKCLGYMFHFMFYVLKFMLKTTFKQCTIRF